MDVYLNHLHNLKTFKKFDNIENEDQILQWYCCDCGRSYGAVLYQDQVMELIDQATEDDNLETVRYYSSLLYNQCHTPPQLADTNLPPKLPTTSDNSEEESTLNDPNYTLQNNGPSACTKDLHPPSSTGPAQTLDRAQKDTHSISQYWVSTPERFTCNRCSHMMCPYCLKLRCKDFK